MVVKDDIVMMNPGSLVKRGAEFLGLRSSLFTFELLQSKRARPSLLVPTQLDVSTPDRGTEDLKCSSIDKRDHATRNDDVTSDRENKIDTEGGEASMISRQKTIEDQLGKSEHHQTDILSLRPFEKPITEELCDRFFDLKVLYSEALWKEVSKKVPNPGDIAMKLKYLGRTEATSRLYIVVHCEKKAAKSVRKFFSQRHLLEELRDDFRICVIDKGVLRLFSATAAEVYRGSWLADTLCGMPINLQRNHESATATLGGLIQVGDGHATYIYGLTAGHAVEEPQSISDDTSSPTGDDFSDDEEDFEEDAEEDDIICLVGHSAYNCDDSLLAKEPLRKFGAIQHFSSRSIAVISGSNRDWALISIAAEDLLPNFIPEVRKPLSLPLMSPDKSAAIRQNSKRRDPFHDQLSKSSQSFAVISCRGLQRGTLAAKGSSIMLRPGTSFVETLDFVPNKDSEMQCGDSGAWVIDEQNGRVYGHVVSVDGFGEAYVMPIHDTLQDVMSHLGAYSASLPSPEDLQKYRKLQMEKVPTKTERLDVGHNDMARVKETTLLEQHQPETLEASAHHQWSCGRAGAFSGNVDDDTVNERLETQSPIEMNSTSRSKSNMQMVSETGCLAGSIEESQIMPPQPPTTQPYHVTEQHGHKCQKGTAITNALMNSSWLIFYFPLLYLPAYCERFKCEVLAIFPVFGASQTNALISTFFQILTFLPQLIICVFIMTRLASTESIIQQISQSISIRATTGSLNSFKFVRQNCNSELSERTSFRWFFILAGRLAIPILIGSSISVLKFQAYFEYYSVDSSTAIEVFGGLTPFHYPMLSLVPTATLGVYFHSWITSLLVDSRYSVSYPLDGCGDRCRSVFLSGGIEMARLVGPTLNVSVFNDGHFDSADIIRLDAAPGLHLKFIDSEFAYNFNLETECLFAASTIGDTLQICAHQAAYDSITVGWATCPNELKAKNECNTNHSWVTRNLRWTTTMTAYLQPATTVYDRKNFSILYSQFTTTSHITSIPLQADEYLNIYRRVLLPTSNASSVENASINALAYSLIWLQRTQELFFPADQNDFLHLHNFVAIPLQFSVNAYQFVNHASPVGSFDMPPENLVTATGGKYDLKLCVPPWTSYFLILITVIELIALKSVIPEFLNTKATQVFIHHLRTAALKALW